jgi:hypothetical protein
MMGSSWPEHVALEIAQGEGFVLQAFYAISDTLDHKPTVDILKRAVKRSVMSSSASSRRTRRSTASRGFAVGCSAYRSSRCGA